MRSVSYALSSTVIPSTQGGRDRTCFAVLLWNPSLIGREISFICPECARTLEKWQALEGRRFKRIELSTKRSVAGRLVPPREVLALDGDGQVTHSDCYEAHLELECHMKCRIDQPPIKVVAKVSTLVEAFLSAVHRGHDTVVLRPNGGFETLLGPALKGSGVYRPRRSGAAALATPSR